MKCRRILIIATFVLLIGSSCYFDHYERGILLAESKQRVDEITMEFFTNWKSSSNSKFSNNLNQTGKFNLIKKSKSGTFPFKYEDYGMMVKMAQNTAFNRLRDCNNKGCQQVISSPKYKLVLIGDSTAIASSLPFTLALRELNISGITIFKTCGFIDNTREVGLENDCIGSRTIAMKELQNQISDNGTVILMINHVHNFRWAKYNHDFITDTMVGLRALLALGYRVVLVYPYTISLIMK